MSTKISINKFAEFLAAKKPARQKALVRRMIREQATDKGFAPYYQAFKTPSREFLQNGATDTAGLARAIQLLANRPGSTKWHATDKRITNQAFLMLQKLAPALRAMGADFLPVPTGLNAELVFPGLNVAVKPDMIVHGSRNGVPLQGALRFFLAKDWAYHLGADAAEFVSTMEYMWATRTSSGERTPDTSLCVVAECLQQRITTAPSDVMPQIALIEEGAEQFVRLWNELSSNKAA